VLGDFCGQQTSRPILRLQAKKNVLFTIAIPRPNYSVLLGYKKRWVIGFK
jgi:hypothetical protein